MFKNMIKKIGTALGLVGAAMVAVPTTASAAFTAPDFSSSITDMGTAFAGVLTLVVAYLGFKYIKRMFA